MNKYGYVLGILLFFNTGIALHAAETEPGYVDSFLNNQYLLENARLIALAEQSYSAAKYDEAIKYAAEADRYARLSDDYVSLQYKIKEVNDSIAIIEIILSRARQTGAVRRYAEAYEKVGLAFTEVLEARDREEWDKARDATIRVFAILETIPDEPFLAAQYLVTNEDCLWDIAAKPEVYGDASQWRHIYNANKDKMPIIDDPDFIRPGMILDIPSIRGEFRSGRMGGE
jgi:nucleoid-associated protein YgaU